MALGKGAYAIHQSGRWYTDDKSSAGGSRMRFFSKKSEKKTYDRNNQKPVIKASICNGEQVAGFKDIHTVMLIRRAEDLEIFKTVYGIEEEITKEY